MKVQSIKQGFTLIELLVVITIIGILATGATTVFTSQIQKARDSTRITDLNSLKSGVNLFYQDVFEFPSWDDFGTGATDSQDKVKSGVQLYVPKMPKDPKNGQTCNNNGWTTDVACAYVYVVANDSNGITNGEFEVSSAFEASGNMTGPALNDDGNDVLRLEEGLNIWTLNTSLETYPWSETDAEQDDKKVVIAGKALKPGTP